jgi:hypothetical protein
MPVELNQLDQVRERTRCSYEEARNALQEANGDVVNALVSLERRSAEGGDLTAIAAELVDDAQRLLDLGPIRKVRFRLGERVLREVPVSVTAVGAVAIGLVAVLLSRLRIDLIRDSYSEEEA